MVFDHVMNWLIREEQLIPSRSETSAQLSSDSDQSHRSVLSLPTISFSHTPLVLPFENANVYIGHFRPS